MLLQSLVKELLLHIPKECSVVMRLRRYSFKCLVIIELMSLGLTQLLGKVDRLWLLRLRVFIIADIGDRYRIRFLLLWIIVCSLIWWVLLIIDLDIFLTDLIVILFHVSIVALALQLCDYPLLVYFKF